MSSVTVVDEKEPLEIECLRADFPELFPELNFPTPLILSEEHVQPALHLLERHTQGNGASVGVLATKNSSTPSKKPKPLIIVTYSHDGDSGGYREWYAEVQVTEALVTELRRSCFVKGTPVLGSTDQENMQISELGRAEMIAYADGRRRAATAENAALAVS